MTAVVRTQRSFSCMAAVAAAISGGEQVTWSPILTAQADGTLDLGSLSQDEQDFLINFKIGPMLGWGPAMLEWPSVRPADFRCPVLWLVGSEDRQVMESLREYEPALAGSPVQVHIFSKLDHGQVLEEIDQAAPVMLAFLKG